MAGVEAAGLVLAVFPLLISAAEDYKRGFEPLLKWFKFRKDFINFINAVDIERHLFSQMLERFLISADVPHEEIHLFMTDPEYDGWQGPELIRILQVRLGPSYDAYMSTLRTMNQLMLDLQELLCLKDGKANWAEEEGKDYQLKRIRLSFSKKGARTLESLETHNRKLRELLDSSDKLESLKSARKDASWGDIFNSIRQHANSLHTALRKSWNCNCPSPHKANLRLQCRSTIDAGSTFNIAFEAPRMSNPPSIKRCEVVIRTKDSESQKNDPSRVPSPSPSPSFSNRSPIQQSYMEELRRDLEAKSTHQVSIDSRPDLTSSISESSVSSLRSSLREVFSGSSSGQSENTSISCTNGTEIVLAESSTRKWLSKSRNSKKSIRIQLPESQALLSPPPIATAIDPPDTKPKIQAKPNTPSLEIHDLCSIISGPIRAESPGYLVDDQQRRFEVGFLSEYDIASPDIAFISLDDLLRGRGGVSLNRQERYQIASVLASSVLQLQHTPWLTERLDKGNVLFLKHGPDIFLEHPYLHHSFDSVKPKQINLGSPVPQPADRFAVRNSLSNLGIVLLELCFGRVIEDQPLRKVHLAADGTPNYATDYMTARDWAELVWKEDPDFDHVIKRCVFCMFEEKADWNNKKFTQAVYCSVVEPLLKINSRWNVT